MRLWLNMGMDMQAPALSSHVARKQRILLIVLGVVIGAVVIFVMAMIFFGKPNLEPLVTKVAAQQQEVLRVNKLADKFAPSLLVRQSQATIASVVGSDLKQIQDTRAELTSEKITKETAGLYVDEEAEDRFQDAAQRNALEREYRDTLRDHLEDLNLSIKELERQSTSQKLKALLSTMAEHNAFLLKEL
jgi:hypothetical protein